MRLTLIHRRRKVLYEQEVILDENSKWLTAQSGKDETSALSGCTNTSRPDSKNYLQ